MRVEFKVFENPAEGKPVGKLTLRPETPEEAAEIDDFRKAIGRPLHGDRLDVVFFPKKDRPTDRTAERLGEAAAHG